MHTRSDLQTFCWNATNMYIHMTWLNLIRTRQVIFSGYVACVYSGHYANELITLINAGTLKPARDHDFEYIGWNVQTYI